MKSESLRRLASIVGVLLLSATAAACGGQGSSATQQVTPGVPRGEMVYVLTGGQAGERGIVAFHPTGDTAKAQVTLPMGLATADHARLFAAVTSSSRTTITAFETRTGMRGASFDIAGAYAMEASGYTGALLSPDGRWLVLRAAQQPAAKTAFALVDTQARRLAESITLDGSFDLDAVSPTGGMLYLLQYLDDADHHYYVRAYDLKAQHLLDAIIVDKTEVNETKMRGTAVARQMASDGSVAYTLYIDPANNHAFIHILPLADDANGPPFARCVDLPVGTDASLLHFYSLALAPDGSVLYAANGALGAAATVSLHGQNIYDDKVERAEKFAGQATGATPDESTRALYHGAALSPDLKTLYVAGLRGVWALDTVDLVARRSLAPQDAFTSLALSGDGRTLYATDPARGVIAIPLAGGAEQALGTFPGAPRGIAWVAA